MLLTHVTCVTVTMLIYHPRVVIAASVGTGDQYWQLVNVCDFLLLYVETLLLI